MFTYLIKSSLVLIVLLAFYKLVLEKESFFRTNRLYLLSCVLLSFLLPLLTLPTVVQHQGIVSTLLEKQVPVAESNSNATFPSTESDQKIIVESVEKDTGAFAKSTSPVTEPGTGTPAPIAWTDWVWYIYLFGVLILGLNVVAQVTNTFWKAASANDRIEDLDCTIVNIAKPTEPCSFFNYVFIHPDSYDFETYEQIVAHEKIHVQQWHSIDLLVAELLIIALWFNPFAWIFRKEIEKNIEYQTDDLLMHNSAPEQKKGYQMNLLKIATYNKPLAITTNYNQSLLRQRILKMNDKKSNAYSYWKYAFVAPLIVGLLLLINKPETMAQQPATDITPSAAVPAEERPQPATEVETTTPITAPVQPTPKKKTPPASANELSVDYCGQLRQAINATDPSRVRSLLSQFDANCLNRPQAGDFDNELLIQKMVENELTIVQLNPLKPSIVLQGPIAQLQVPPEVEVSELASTINPMNCPSFNDALRSGDPQQLKTVLLDLSPDCLSIPSEANLENLEYVKSLLRKGAAVSVGLLQLEIDLSNERTVLVESATENNTPALMEAARSGNLQRVKKLIAEGADPNQLVAGEGTPLMAAAGSGALPVVKFLLTQKVDINRVTPGIGTALSAAARSGALEVLQYLLSQNAQVNLEIPGVGSAFSVGVSGADLRVIKYLLANGADINQVINGVGTPLMVSIRNLDLHIIKYLVEQGAQINQPIDFVGSPLITAVYKEDIPIVEFLLSNGADLTLKVNGVPLPMEIAQSKGNPVLIELLQKAASEK